MPDVPTATCQNCGWNGPADNTRQLRNILDRVFPGDVMPAGECPVDGCRSAAMLDDPSHPAEDLRPPLTALMIGLNRLQERLFAANPDADTATTVRRLADYARDALAPATSLQPVCNTCRGQRVLIDAWAAWDIPNQTWQLHSTYEPTAHCEDCDTECSYSMKPLTETG